MAISNFGGGPLSTTEVCFLASPSPTCSIPIQPQSLPAIASGAASGEDGCHHAVAPGPHLNNNNKKKKVCRGCYCGNQLNQPIQKMVLVEVHQKLVCHKEQIASFRPHLFLYLFFFHFSLTVLFRDPFCKCTPHLYCLTPHPPSPRDSARRPRFIKRHQDKDP